MTPKWPLLGHFEDLFGPYFTKHQRNRGNFWNNGPKGPSKWPQNDHFWVILRTFLDHILPNTNGIGGTFEIMIQKDPPNDPRWPFLRTLFRPHITKHQRNRGYFWNNGPKGPCFNPKPCRFYWYLAKIWPKSALNDPKNDQKWMPTDFEQLKKMKFSHLVYIGASFLKVAYHGNIKHT
jgi:hypothetical protein